MAHTTTPVRPSTAPSAMTTGVAPTRPAMTRGERDRLTSDLRMACMRISRRVRFEINPAAAEQARLKMSSQLLKLATLVTGPRS